MNKRPIFEHGEAEGVVKKLRALLRTAEAEEARGNLAAAQDAQTESDALVTQLLKRLAPRLDRYAMASFPDDSGDGAYDTREDAVGEMIFQLCRGLRDLRDRPGAKYYETNFNAAVKYCLFNAIRKVGREQERDDEGKLVVSLDEMVAVDEGGGESRGHRVEDEAARRALNKVLGDDFSAAFLEQLARQTSPRYEQVFRLRIAGLTWGEIAKSVGISDRTARTYYDTAVSLLKKFMADA